MNFFLVVSTRPMLIFKATLVGYNCIKEHISRNLNRGYGLWVQVCPKGGKRHGSSWQYWEFLWCVRAEKLQRPRHYLRGNFCSGFPPPYGMQCSETCPRPRLPFRALQNPSSHTGKHSQQRVTTETMHTWVTSRHSLCQHNDTRFQVITAFRLVSLIWGIWAPPLSVISYQITFPIFLYSPALTSRAHLSYLIVPQFINLGSFIIECTDHLLLLLQIIDKNVCHYYQLYDMFTGG